ncbi:MAG: amino acid adenylation domain-containing protein [Cyanobacteria bacterium CAN_BIN43]|nr:amino acid adenylation domain-containing protein [Cyanobacteria bacterium CAN_BIN43]
MQAIQSTVREMRADGFWPRSSSGSSTLPSAQQQATTVLSTATVKVEQADSAPSSKVWNRQKPLGSRVDRKSVDLTRITNFSSANRHKKLDFSLYYFGEYEAQFSQGKYDLLFAGAKFADRHGFTAIWIPERHFHSFGGFSPNPSVLGAGLARETDKIQIRAGSVVLPLHHPIRVAEEWSVVDNLSQGRVGIAFASGWHPNDFVFAPESYGHHRELMFQGIETVQKLWRGESISVRGGAGNQIDVQTFPLPMQSQLPTWITVVNNPETYIKAGEIGAGILTNLMNQTIEDLAENIALYRESLSKNGHDPASGQVTVLLHTLLGNDIDTVRQQARQPFCNYLRSSLGLFQNLVKSQGLQVDIDSLSEDDKNFILSAAFDRYVQNSALIGTPDSCAPIINNLLAINVDEIACFIDFGVDIDIALEGLPYVNELKERYQHLAPDSADKSLCTTDEIDSIPLTKAQQQLWFLAQLGDNSSAAYNESAILQLRGELNLAAIEHALQKVVDRHEALRTKIDRAGDVQHISPLVKIEVPVIDFSDVNDDEQESQVTAWLQEDRQTPFDFTQNSLFRCQILKLEAQQHLLVVSAHHIITDGWSMGIMLQEIAAIYSAECENTSSQLTSPLQFRTYAQWLEQQAETAAMASHQSYWLEQLYAPIPVLELPTDRPRRATKTYLANRQTIQLETKLSNDLRRVSREQGCTLFMTILSAYKTLLHRLTGQADILIGIPTAGRSLQGSQELIGYCTHLLPIRSQFVDNLSFLEYLRTLRGVLLDAYEHQDYPYANLLYHLSEQKQTHHSPLITATFNLETSLVTPEMSGLDTSLYPGPIGCADHDLSLNIIEVNTELLLSCDYSTDLFDAATISRMLGHFQTLLAEIIVNPDRQISTLPILTSIEQQLLLVDWNATHKEYPQAKCIHQLFEEQVAKTPDAIAVVFVGGASVKEKQQELTYRQLNQRANQLAHYLQTLGVKPEELVGICVERSLEMVVGLLGILKAGGAYVPLDPSYPAERLSYLLSDSGVKVLLTQDDLLSSLPSHDAQMICLDSEGEVIDAHSQENPIASVGTDNLAYVIYTSGSTGQPKGVMIPHQNLVKHAVTIAAEYNLISSDRVLQFAALSFDVALEEILPAWLSGAIVVLNQPEMFTSMVEWVELIETQSLTVLNLPAAFWQEWVVDLSTSQRDLPSCLRLVIVGSEQVQWSRVAPWQKHVPSHIELYNAYGVTEATITATVYKLALGNQEQRTGIIPIGRPISNTQVYILDRQMQPVPIGVAGELHIGGDGLARGYLNRPELTQTKFLPNHFLPEKSARLYKTGDLARYLSDGNIEFLGRIDHQVKIRGFRIELGEIEAVLSSHPQIQQAVAIATADPVGNQRLVAYVVSEEEELSTQQLREFLQQQLPAYMVPSAFIILDTLPLTPNGKVDRKALPAPDGEIERTQKYVAPQTPNQEIIAHIFTTVLGIETVGIHDNFFELGGHSLLATQLTSRLKQSFTVDIPLRAIFEAPTVAQLDRTISQLRTEEQGLSLPAITRIAPNSEPIPLSFAQERLWFLHQLEGASATYNMPAALRLTGELNLEALQQALTEIVRRHEALRTSFTTVNGIPIQVIHPSASMTIETIDLQHLTNTEREVAIEQQIQQSALAPFDLEIAPLIRCNLLQLAETDYVFCINMHHIVSDGWSIGVLVQELSALYPAYCAGNPSPLPELEIQYADFALWQRQWLSGEILEQQLQYWVSQLQGAPELSQLPTDHPRPSVQTYRGATHSLSLSAELAQKLQALSRQTDSTLFMTLLATFATLLYRYSGESDVVIGSPIANRNRSEIESLIGFFVNTLVLRTRLEEDLSFEQLLKQVRANTLKAYEHQDLPFEQLVEALQPHRSMSHSPLFQVMFDLQNTPLGEIELPGVTLSEINQESTVAKFDLNLSMTETLLGLDCEWEYNTDLFDKSTIERMASHFDNLLAAIVANPHQAVSELPLLTPTERQQLLFEWNDTQTDYPQDRCIHQLFEQQVAKTPDAIAVVFERQELTYKQLNERANQLAHYLQTLGVEPEVLVGICVERSLEMVVGLLGILKAGGAYVPLDPSYPTERFGYLLSDAGVEVLLTQNNLLSTLPSHSAQVVCLDTDGGVIESHCQDNLVTGVSADNLAYVIYTSGSTGQPKGVTIPHRSLVKHSTTIAAEYHLTASDRVLQFAALSFDVALEEIFPTWLSGATVVLRPQEMFTSVVEWVEFIELHSLTVLNLPAAFWQEWVADLSTSQQDLPSCLRLVIVGSEQVQWSRVALWQQHAPSHIELYNAYGVTEATITATVYKLDLGNQEERTGNVSIGRPTANTQIYILDSQLQPVPIGVAGELHIGGDGLARGYLNRPELTQTKFGSNPFSSDKSSRLYKTGDLARYLSDGNIEFLGRIDHQVKIRGFRIELGEIEAVLSSHPQIQQAVVIATADPVGNQRLVAYLVSEEEKLSTQQLREFLQQQLPAYMVPSAFVILDNLPLTPNGKVDRQALPKPDISMSSVDFGPPRTHTEEVLVEIWQKVLKVEKISVYDNFFDLGGHSLLATQVSSQISEAFQVKLPLKNLFEASTLASLAEEIDNISLALQAFQNHAIAATTNNLEEEGTL